MLWPNPDKPNRNISQKPGTYHFTALAGAISVLLTLWCWLMLGPILAQAILLLAPSTMTRYLAVNVPFLAMALGLYLSTQLILKVPLRALVTDIHPIRWKLILFSALAYASMLLVFTIAAKLLHPDQYVFQTGKSVERLLLLPFVLVLTPLQTTSEELLFRILPARLPFKGSLPTKPSSILLSSAMICIFFTVPHLGNKEILHAQYKGATILYYALFGFLITLLSLKAKGFEPAIGLHAANNLFIALVCNYTDSSLPSLPLFIDTRPVGTYYDVLLLCVGIGIVGLVTCTIAKSPA